MKKQRESGAHLRISVNARNQRLGRRTGAEQRIGQVGLRGNANMGQSLVFGQASDQVVEIRDVVGPRLADHERTRVRPVVAGLLLGHNGLARRAGAARTPPDGRDVCVQDSHDW